MRLVIVESPYRGNDPSYERLERNRGYLAACLRDALERGESPQASHGLLTAKGVLDDTDERQRQLGIEAGRAWGRVADAVVFYADLGWSSGMLYAKVRAEAEGWVMEERRLGGEWAEP